MPGSPETRTREVRPSMAARHDDTSVSKALGMAAHEGEATGGHEAARERQAAFHCDERFPFHPNREQWRRETFQRPARAHRGEPLARPRAGDDPCDIGAEDLPARGGGAQPGRLDHRCAEEVPVLQSGVAEAQPDAHLEALDVALVPVVDRLLHGHGARDPVRRRRGRRP